MDFYPSVSSQLEHGYILVWRMPVELSQSRLGGRLVASNACTIICMKLAELIHRSDVRVPQVNRVSRQESVLCPRDFLKLLTDAIVEGNELHEKAMKCGKPTENFTIPEAIVASGQTLLEIDFCSVKGEMWKILPRYLRFAINNPVLKSTNRLFFMMIAYERTILLVYERSTATFLILDSHLHEDGASGALLAVCAVSELCFLADWLSEKIFPESLSLKKKNKQVFELSLLSYQGILSSADCATPDVLLPPFPIFNSSRRRISLKRSLPPSTACSPKQCKLIEVVA